MRSEIVLRESRLEVVNIPEMGLTCVSSITFHIQQSASKARPESDMHHLGTYVHYLRLAKLQVQKNKLLLATISLP